MIPPVQQRVTLDLDRLAETIVRVPDSLRIVRPIRRQADWQVSPALFSGHGAAIDWGKYVKTGAQKAALSQAIAAAKAGGKGAHPVATHLRWMMHAIVGLPTAPFQVWQRLTHLREGQELEPPQSMTAVGDIVTTFFRTPLAKLFVALTAGPNGAVLSALRGLPLLEGAELPVLVPANATRIVTLSSPSMAGVSMSGVAQVHGATGLTIHDYAALDGWQLVDTVGLPAHAPGMPGWAGPQGPGESPGLDPHDAAMGRLATGGAPFGWEDRMDAATAAPAWAAPDAAMLLASLLEEGGLVPSLFDAMHAPMTEQRKHRVPVAIDAVDVGPVTLPPGSADLPTLGIAQLAASTDPFLALALGFGTAVPPPDKAEVEAYARAMADPMMVAAAANTRLPDVDFLVTGAFGDAAHAFRLAAPIPAPPIGLVPFPPTSLTATPAPPDRPAAADAPWSAAATLGWDRVPRNSLYTVASAAGARAGAAGCDPILEARTGGGWHMIAATAGSDANGDQLPRYALRDPGVPLAGATLQQRWGVAQQTAFGLWSRWATAGATLEAPAPQVPVIAALRLEATPGATFADRCPAVAELELLYDWSVRRPATITLRARMYAAATRSAPLPDATLPAGFDRGAGPAGAGPGGEAIVITFDGDVPSATGAHGVTILPLDPDTGAALAGPPGPVRRYRVRVPGLGIDFGLGHAGIAIWAMAVERVAPSRASAWSPPRSCGAADPRPPQIVVPPVHIGSLPDAEGRSHVGLSWNASSPGGRYEVFESDEVTLLAHAGRPEPALGATLAERLAVLKALDIASLRPAFARRDGPPVTGASVDVAMPRGSSVFHAFVVLGVSAGGVESAWPTHESQVQFVHPARALAPPAPWLHGFLRNGQVELRVEPQPGVAPATIELFRTRLPQAAVDVRMMGPPVASVAADGLAPRDIVDHPAPSWRPWWYRAVCRSADDPGRALHGARGAASGGFKLLVPPSGPPPLSGLVVAAAPGGKLDLVFTSALPRQATPLGAHRIAIEGAASAAFAVDALPAGVARLGTDWRWTFARPSAAAFDLLVRVTDPLGRVAEQAIHVPGAVAPAPLPFGPRAQVEQGKVRLTALLPPAAFSAAAAQTLMVELPGADILVADAALASIGSKNKVLAPGVTARRLGVEDGMAGLLLTLPETPGPVRLTLTGGGVSLSREVRVTW